MEKESREFALKAFHVMQKIEGIGLKKEIRSLVRSYPEKIRKHGLLGALSFSFARLHSVKSTEHREFLFFIFNFLYNDTNNSEEKIYIQNKMEDLIFSDIFVNTQKVLLFLSWLKKFSEFQEEHDAE